ncbi:hypothetical protein EIQ06_13675 [Xanthomonas campestris pv. campestris]|uniref:Uncharacterized protein n=1 Tax=Xanthomonas campestris pv. campestris (strain B100) TaxID=509169 RepID=B0RQC6_XANCB|nr:hypothetical protein D0A42_21075 [Xanthomonas campestris pv. campestris]RFF72514.1 hypothetical protein DZE36_19340 [Xanthomonas campestris pv. campestris]CAP50661.1 hypothetical protein XCCB100_1311 [Xanthomonas campestris pv. campestris]
MQRSTAQPSHHPMQPRTTFGDTKTRASVERRRGTARSTAPPTHRLVTLRTNVEHARLRRRRRTPGLPAAMDGTTKTPINEALRNR